MRRFLEEDLGSGDVTTKLTVPPGDGTASIICEESAVVAGIEEAAGIFSLLGVSSEIVVKDGETVESGTLIMKVSGSLASIVTGERTALNFMMRMTGIATSTSKAAKLCSPSKVAGTRKTTPGFREYEKKAIILGGGLPHRYGLYDAILIKDNHIRAAGGIAEAMEAALKAEYSMALEIEVESMEDAVTAAKMGADIILVDNKSPEEVEAYSEAVKAIDPDIKIEASGGISMDNIASYAGTADIISMGSLTHSVKAVQFSLDVN